MPRGHYIRPAARSVIYTIGPSIAYVTLTQNQLALIDAEDGPLLGQFNWQADWAESTQSYYAVHAIKLGGRKTGKIRMARFLLGITDPEKTGDHRNRVTLDYRKANLRIADDFQSRQNRYRKNKSGIKGVFLCGKRWRGSVSVKGLKYDCGSHPTKELAAAAVATKTLELHGEFACLCP